MSDDCPRLTQADGSISFRHLWHPKVSAAGGSVHVRACDGNRYFLTGIGWGGWPIGKYTRYEWRARRWLRRCEAWCERQNTKEAREAARTTSILKRL